MEKSLFRFTVSRFVVTSLALVGMMALGNYSALAFPVQVAEAPTDDLSLTVSAIQSAQRTLLLNIYELTSPQIADALISRIQAGVRVEIIEEGQPVGGLSAAAKGIQSQIVQAMRGKSGDRFFEMTSNAKGTRRFHFDHAKYAVIDDQSLLIGSENYSPTGNPQPGSLGNRGWEVFIHDPKISQEFQTMFTNDADTSHGDILDLTSGNGHLLFESMTAFELAQGENQDQGRDQNQEELLGKSGGRGTGPVKPIKPPKKPPVKPPVSHPGKPTAPSVPIGSPGNAPVLNATDAVGIVSPTTSLSGIEAALNQARTSIDIEQMTFDSAWAGANQSPLVAAVISAAKRGVRVRVLLNDESVFNHPGHPAKPKNTVTITLLNQAASQQRLNLTAKVANLKAMGVDYIHNKGLLIDGDKTLISSINWDENSVEKNREAAVLITSPEIHVHYEALFERDWQVSGGAALQENFMSGLEAEFMSKAPETLNCPNKARVRVQVGSLKASDDVEDREFSTISNKTIEGEFVRTSQAESCVLSIDNATVNTGSQMYVQIRTSSDGMKLIAFEGYTPTSRKMYSVRAKIDPRASLDGSHNAIVFDGSGPAREKLGQALLSFSTSQ